MPLPLTVDQSHLKTWLALWYLENSYCNPDRRLALMAPELDPARHLLMIEPGLGRLGVPVLSHIHKLQRRVDKYRSITRLPLHQHTNHRMNNRKVKAYFRFWIRCWRHNIRPRSRWAWPCRLFLKKLYPAWYLYDKFPFYVRHPGRQEYHLTRAWSGLPA